MDKEDLIQHLPDGAKPLLSEGFHIISPTASWDHFRKRREAREMTNEFSAVAKRGRRSSPSSTRRAESSIL